MLKFRIIPILTFNGFALVKTKKFANPRMVGNPIQTARIYNSRGVDELVFVDITATKQNRVPNFELIAQVIKECFMPVCVGGGISSIEDINKLLKAGADKVLIKSKALADLDFVKEAVSYFGSQCISIAIDAVKVEDKYLIHHNGVTEIDVESFVNLMNHCDVGEFVVNAVNNDGMMNGYDIELLTFIGALTNKPIIAVGGAGVPDHFNELAAKSKVDSFGASSIYHFTQYTPNDIKINLSSQGYPIRISKP
ncbi:cyclase [Pedobacter sp. AK017]|uniref:imidazole glycerol phosphate synthase subunit HisF n=1 Tax=Pedobacter sp. AK017 TaxID=2723073 RepID=UPI00160AAB09|nr:imidazole glycerol phosphate synthase cyclase subunit [Pedobacter sp. AK017]MBB5439639.1 cyclase [Pedobacter sp. AK017]